MSQSERRPALVDCGCEVTVYADGSGIEIHYCPLHQAAPELLEVLKTAVVDAEAAHERSERLADIHNNSDWVGQKFDYIDADPLPDWVLVARAAITKATGA